MYSVANSCTFCLQCNRTTTNEINGTCGPIKGIGIWYVFMFFALKKILVKDYVCFMVIKASAV